MREHGDAMRRLREATEYEAAHSQAEISFKMSNVLLGNRLGALRCDDAMHEWAYVRAGERIARRSGASRPVPAKGMGMRHRADSNAKVIADAAEALDFLVHRCNNDLCDMIVQWRGTTELWECKSKNGKMTPKQNEMRAKGWNIRTVRSIEDVIDAKRYFL